MKKLRNGLLIFFAGTLLVSGCGSSDSVSKEDYDALANQLAEASARLDELESEKTSQEPEEPEEEDFEEISDDIDDLDEEEPEEESEKKEESGKTDNSEISTDFVEGFTGSEFDIEDGFTILSDYTYYYSGLDGKIEHIIVIRNDTERNVEIESESSVYSPDAELIGLCDSRSGSGIDILGPGEISAIHEYNNEDIADSVGYYKTKFMIKDSKDEPFYSDIECTANFTPSNVILEAKNNSNVTVKTLIAALIYFKDGELTDFDRLYFTSSGDELAPGDTGFSDSSSRNDYDTVNFYLYGH